MSARQTKVKKGGRKKADEPANLEVLAEAATPLAEIQPRTLPGVTIREAEVAARPPRPVATKSIRELKRTADPPVEDRAQKRQKTTMLKSVEIIGIDVDNVSPMVGESLTDVPMAIPIGTTTSRQRSIPDSSASRGKHIFIFCFP